MEDKCKEFLSIEQYCRKRVAPRSGYETCRNVDGMRKSHVCSKDSECGNAGKNLGDSMYDGTIFIGGDIQSLGVDAVEAELTDLDQQWLTRNRD